MSIHRKYISFDSTNERQAYVYDIISEKKGHYLTDYIVEAILRYESCKKAEEQKRISQLLGYDYTPQETCGIKKDIHTSVEDSKIAEDPNDVSEKSFSIDKVKNSKKSNDNLVVDDSDNAMDDEDKISDITVANMMSAFHM